MPYFQPISKIGRVQIRLYFFLTYLGNLVMLDLRGYTEFIFIIQYAASRKNIK